jgi:gliding motility-associated-like protein
VIVTDEKGCEITDSITIIDYPAPDASILASDIEIMQGDAVTLEADINPPGTYNYQWSPDYLTDCPTCEITDAFPPDTTIFTLEVTDQFGCSDTSQILIIVLPCGSFYVPDIFSPNMDNLNDEWMVLGTCMAKVEVMVYDRWGELIFYSDDENMTWDGTYKGRPVEVGTYAYTVEVEFHDGTVKKQTGNLKVIR